MLVGHPGDGSGGNGQYPAADPVDPRDVGVDEHDLAPGFLDPLPEEAVFLFLAVESSEQGDCGHDPSGGVCAEHTANAR